jgi:GTP-binding protein
VIHLIDFNQVEFETAFGSTNQLIESTCPEIVFAGRSNVGKSSVINKICNRKKLARVSAAPGKTTTINFYRASGFRLVDIPGYGYAKTAKIEQARWRTLINSYFAMKRQILLLLLLIDIRHPPSNEDIIMVNMLTALNLSFVFVLTKADKIAKTKVSNQAKHVISFFNGHERIKCIPFSSITNQGTDEIKMIINEVLKS